MAHPSKPALDFSGKTVLITGGTSGIGRHAAIAFAAAGANVVLTGRREPEGEAVAKEVRGHGVKSVFTRGDVTDESHVERAVKTAVDLGGGTLHAAFNNAGIELTNTTVDATPEMYRKVFDINVLGVLLCMKHELRAMTAGSSIVNNASIAGSLGFPGAGIYVGSKHAVLGLTKSAALEHASRGVRVNAVSPAAIETDMLDRFTGGSQHETIEFFKSLHPIGRLGKSDEIAYPVLFLCSDHASFITGHDLRVDGAFTAQ